MPRIWPDAPSVTQADILTKRYLEPVWGSVSNKDDAIAVLRRIRECAGLRRPFVLVAGDHETFAVNHQLKRLHPIEFSWLAAPMGG